jgi:exodeoxyribonuclease VII large subunit
MSRQSLTLLELNEKIKSAINESFDAPVWLVAEINNINLHRSGHCYLELVQKSEYDDKIIAQMRATIWASQYRFIAAYFKSVTQRDIEKGMSILVKVSVEFHELYSISLNIREIEPSFTLGDLEKRKKEIIDKLISEGVFDMNKLLHLPDVIQRVAIISSSSAAGFEDFINHIENNKFGYKFELSLFEANMQGTGTEESVIEALNEIYENIENFDVVAIIRGGGSKSDLSYFDNYNIAYHVTQFPIPVIAGIGHERDESVTDMVAHTKLKTPTAVANFIVDYNNVFETEVFEIFKSIVTETQYVIENKEMYLASLGLKIYKIKDVLIKNNEDCNRNMYRVKNASVQLIRKNENRLNNYFENLKLLTHQKTYLANKHLENSFSSLKKNTEILLSKNELKLQNLSKNIELANPENVLKRGFSISKINGKIIDENTNIMVGDELETITFSNKILSNVTKNKKK